MEYQRTNRSHSGGNENPPLSSFDCQFCDRHFRSRADQCLHKMDEHGAFYLCSFCDKQFCKQYETLEHVKKDHNARNRFWCIYCWRLFDDQSFLRAHQNYAHKSNDMQLCPRCQKLAPNQACLKVHLEYEDGFRRARMADQTSHHSNDNRHYQSKNEQTKIFCLHCFKRYPIDNFDRHARDHLIKSEYLACNECFVVIKNDHNFKSHKACLIAEALRSSDRLAIICRKCDFRSIDDAQFDRHYNWCHSTKKPLHIVANEVQPLATCLNDAHKTPALPVSLETRNGDMDQHKFDNSCNARKPLLPDPLIVTDQIDYDFKANAIDLMSTVNLAVKSSNKTIHDHENRATNKSSDHKPVKRRSTDDTHPNTQIDSKKPNQLNKKVKFEDSSTSSSDEEEEANDTPAWDLVNNISQFPSPRVGEVSRLINSAVAQNVPEPFRENLSQSHNKDNMARNLLQNLKNNERRSIQSQPKMVSKYQCTLCPAQPTVYLTSIKRHLTHVHKVCVGDEYKFYDKKDILATDKTDAATQVALASFNNTDHCGMCAEKEAKIRKLSDLMKILVAAASQVQ